MRRRPCFCFLLTKQASQSPFIMLLLINCLFSDSLDHHFLRSFDHRSLTTVVFEHCNLSIRIAHLHSNASMTKIVGFVPRVMPKLDFCEIQKPTWSLASSRHTVSVAALIRRPCATAEAAAFRCHSKSEPWYDILVSISATFSHLAWSTASPSATDAIVMLDIFWWEARCLIHQQWFADIFRLFAKNAVG